MQRQLAARLLILASLTFGISWLLMPDPGTTDTAHILSIVKQSRTSVLASVVTQIISSVLYIAALFSFSKYQLIQKRITWIGAACMAIGALGLCSDAFFHLLAYYMTDNEITIQQDVVRVMEFMQTDALVFLIPILVPLFIGTLLFAIGLSRQGEISRMTGLICVTAFLMLFVGNAIPKMMNTNPIPYLVLIVFGLFAIAQTWMAIEIINKKEKTSLAFLHIN